MLMIMIMNTIFTRGKYTFNTYTPMSDQDRISAYSVNTILNRQVVRMKKMSIEGILVDSIPKSLK